MPPKASTAKRTGVAAALAVAIAIPAEGLRTVAYRDPIGIPTICFGSTRGVQMGDRVTVEQCHKMLTAEMLDAVETVDRCLPGLPVKVLAAFSDAVYNMGPTITCSNTGSTARKLLLAKQYDAACNQLPRWDKARVAGVLVSLPGLTKRRVVERELCLDWRADQAHPAPAITTIPETRPLRPVRAQVLVRSANDQQEVT